jgi:hypothetical protein
VTAPVVDKAILIVPKIKDDLIITYLAFFAELNSGKFCPKVISLSEAF